MFTASAAESAIRLELRFLSVVWVAAIVFDHATQKTVEFNANFVVRKTAYARTSGGGSAQPMKNDPPVACMPIRGPRGSRAVASGCTMGLRTSRDLVEGL